MVPCLKDNQIKDGTFPHQRHQTWYVFCLAPRRLHYTTQHNAFFLLWCTLLSVWLHRECLRRKSGCSLDLRAKNILIGRHCNGASRMLPSSVGSRYAPHRHGSSYGQSMSVSWSLPDYLRRMFDYHQVSQIVKSLNRQILHREKYPKLVRLRIVIVSPVV